MNERPPVPQEKKGIPVLGWVGIGCGTLLIIAIMVISLLIGWCKRTVGDISEFKRNPEKAAAEMIVRLDPDLDMVTQDESKGEMTIRTKDGSHLTASYKDIVEGKLTVKDAQGKVIPSGNTDLTDIPAWVPRVPEIKTASATIRDTGTGKTAGLYTATTSATGDEVADFFTAEAAKLGFTRNKHHSVSADGVESRTLTFEGAGRKLDIVITSKPGEDTRVNAGYEE